ncbi:MAG: RusA family crossover junction endodeoxyribonuclease [Caldilineaceae bacterium]|nr:RusA family crossover junction endodeoxyribonuclease [Caldilineaceae bacterium]
MSQQARRRERLREWRQEVNNAAKREWTAEPFDSGPLMVTITYVYDEDRLDVDNIPKPILDGLKQVVFSDDSRITDMLCRRRDLKHNLQVQTFSPVFGEALAKSTPFVHILVDHAPDQGVIS